MLVGNNENMTLVIFPASGGNKSGYIMISVDNILLIGKQILFFNPLSDQTKRTDIIIRTVVIQNDSSLKHYCHYIP